MRSSDSYRDNVMFSQIEANLARFVKESTCAETYGYCFICISVLMLLHDMYLLYDISKLARSLFVLFYLN